MIGKRIVSMLVSAALLATSVFSGYCFAEPSEKIDWTANWIWNIQTPTTLPEEGDVWVNFRKEFTLDSLPQQKVVADIAAESRYFLYINGELAVFEGGLKRGLDRESGYYDKVDITDYLKVGKNTIAVAVWYYGVAGTASGDGRSQSFTGYCASAAGFMFEAKIGNVTIVSDSSWKAKRDSAYLHSVDYDDEVPNYRFLESNVYYDATKSVSDSFMGWVSEDFDDSTWGSAVVRGKYGDAPWHKLYERNIPLLKFDKEIQSYENPEAYAEYTQNATTSEVKIEMQLPYNAQVTPYLEIEADAGKKIDVRTDTYAYVTGSDANSVRANYITKQGVQSFESFGWFSGEKVIYTIPAGVKIISLGYRESGYNTEFVGSFVSDDEDLNTLWQKSLRTLYITMRDNYMDCPDRERAQWWGDVTNEMYMTFYSLDSSSWELYEKGLYTKLGFIQDDVLYTVVPNTNYYAELPMQELAGIVGVWEYYMNSGREYIIADFYNAAKNYLMLWNMQKSGLIEHRPFSSGWHDWCDWGSNQDVTAIENAWYYMALGSVINMAKLLDKESEITELEFRREKIESAYHTLWTTAGFKSASMSKADDRANAVAVLSGLSTSEQNAVILEKVFLNSDCYFASPYMEYYVLSAMAKLGAVSEAQARIKTRYSEMIDSDISTLYEFWSYPSGSGSKNHAWSGGALVTMSRDMAGISPIESGYKTYQIKPNLGSLNSVAVSVPSAVGDIKLDMTKDVSGEVVMDVVAPDGADAIIAVPRIKNGATVVSVNGTVIFDGTNAKNNVSGIVYSKNDSDYIYFNAKSGSYKFVTTLSAEQKGEYTLNVANVSGGTLTLNVGGTDKELPFNSAVAKDTAVTVKAKADDGYLFTGFTGTYGESSDTLSFTMTADTTVVANFVKAEVDTRKKLTVRIPDGSDVKVTYANTLLADGDVIKVGGGNTVTLSAKDGSTHRFVNWQGYAYSADNTVSFAVTEDCEITVKSAFVCAKANESAQNLANGATVTSSHGQTIGTWKPSALTDGSKETGFTSTQQSQTTAQWIVVDLGESKTFDSVILYPRTDEACNFPEQFKLSVSTNGTSYTDFAAYSNVTDVTEPFVCSGKAVTARYIRLDVSKLGKKSGEESNPRLQIMELEAKFTGVASEYDLNVFVNASSTGSGKVLIDGAEYTLPASVKIPAAQLVKVEAVADANCCVSSMTGDVESKSAVTYIYAYSDTDISVLFGNHNPSGATSETPTNVALGKTVTAPGGIYQAKPQWCLENLTDGVYGTDAGFTSKSSPSTPYDIIVDLGSKQEIDTVVMYARNTSLTTDGYCSYYPSAFTISVSMDGQSYETVRSFSGETKILPKDNKRVYGLGKLVNARYIKISVTSLGTPEKGTSAKYIQLQELEAYNSGNLALGKSATDSAGNFQNSGASWYTGNITDGLIMPNGSTMGWSTKDLANSQDISSSPHKLTVDLGSVKLINRVVLYGRTDDNASFSTSGICPCFPENFTIDVSTDGVNFVTVKRVEGECVTHAQNRRVYDLDMPINARYFRITTTKLGASTAGETSENIYRIQLYEIQAYLIERDYTQPVISLSKSENTICTDEFEITVNSTSENTVVTAEDKNGHPSKSVDIIGDTVIVKQKDNITINARDDNSEAMASKLEITTGHDYNITNDSKKYYYACSDCGTVKYEADYAPMFKDGFTDSIIPDTALLVDKNAASSEFFHKANWDGTNYTFIKGINAFASLADANTYAKAQGIETPNFILLDLDGYKGDTEYNTFCATIPGNYYTQNWNKMPFTKGEAEDGSDWTSNIGTGAGKFDTSKGIRIKYFSFKQAEGVGAGSYKFYGFTITSTIEDTKTRTVATPIDVLFENTFFNGVHEGAANSFYYASTSSNSASPNASADKFEFKNMYYKPLKTAALMDNESLWATTIFDGLYADFKDATIYDDSAREVRHYANNSELIIRNSNIRNLVPDGEHITYTGLGAATGTAGTRKLTLDNNIFYNYYFYTTSEFMKVPVAYLSEFNFTNNKVYNVSGTDTKLFTTTGTGNGVNEDLKITITGNYLNGFDGNVAVEDRNIAASSAVSTNYLASTYAAEQTQTGKPLNIQGLGTTNYYLDAAMTKLSGNVYGMTLNEQAFDEDKGSYSVTVPASTNKVNLNDYIVNDYNVLTAYSDEAMTISADITALEIAPAGSVYYVKVASNDLASVQSRTVSIIREDGFAVGNTGLGSSFNKTENEVTYNWLSWRGSVNATGSLTFAGGTEMEHRVGVIYFSELTNVNDLKAAITNEFTQNGGTLETADAVIDSVNASVNCSTVKAYVMSANKTLVWDCVSQSYGYRYNFSVPDEYVRGAIMYAVYEGEDGLEVIFSDMVVQKS